MMCASAWIRPARRTVRWASVFAMVAAGAGPAAAAVNVLSSDAGRVVLEVLPGEARVVPASASGREYVRISFPGFGETSEVGRPEIPVSSARLAVPPGTTPRLRVLEETWSERRPGAVVPVGERIGVREPFGADRVIEHEPVEGDAYRSRTIYPETAFELSGIAGLGHLRTVSVIFHGARAEIFTRSHVLLERAVLEVVFAADGAGPIRRTERPAARDELWDKTVRGSVLNAERAGAWARGGAADGALVGDAPWGAGDQWKILVPETGMARVTFESLASAGFPGGIDVDDIALVQREFDLDEVDDPSTPAPALFVRHPVPIRMNDGGDGLFGPGDSFWFYGRSHRDQWMTSGLEHEDSFGQENFVWVSIDPANASRMTTLRPGGSLSGSATDSLASTRHTVFVEKDTAYYTRPPDFAAGTRAYEAEFYYRNDTSSPTTDDNGIPTGWILKSGGLPYDSFDVPDPAPGTPGTLVVRVVGGGRPIDSNFTTRFEATINEAAPPVAQKTFYNANLYPPNTTFMPAANVLHSFAIPAGILVPGSNRFSFRGESFTGNGTSSPLTVTRFFFDWFQVSYDRRLVARSDRLTLSTSSGAAATLLLRVSGFTGTDLRLFDVTDPAAPAEVGVIPAQVVADGGGFALRFDHDNAAGAATYAAVRASQIPQIATSAITRVAAPTLLAGGIGARYVAVAHDAFLSGAQELAADRGARMSSIATPVSQVWDVFGNGMRDPRALKAYVAYAFHRWSDPPAFLSLIGDASEDHRGLTSESSPDFLPSHSLWTAYEGTTEESDQYFVEVTRGAPADPDGFDDVPDLYVGRLAVGTPQELDWNLRRIRAYEDPNLGADQSWRRQVLLLADDAFSGDLGGGFGIGYRFQANEVTFRTYSDIYAETLNALPFDSLIVDKLYLSQFTMPCKDSCYTSDVLQCEADLGLDCGIWYDCRDAKPSFPEEPPWIAQYTCMRGATRAAVLPELLSKLNAGKLIWNFEGHANRFFLCHEEAFKDDIRGGNDVDAVDNEGKPFLFFGFACHLAEFDSIDELVEEDCVSEKLMNLQDPQASEPGGAIGVFASSGFEFLGPNLGFNADIFQAFFQPELALPAGTLPDTPGEGGVYAWTLGEATTRARLLYQNRYPWSTANDQNRQAALRFVLLGDPAVTPDIGGPEIRVTANGAPVANGQFLDVDAEGGPIEIIATVDHGRGIGTLRLVDTANGEVPASAVTIAVSDSTVDGVARRKTLTHSHVQHSGSYDLVIEASNERGVFSSFTMSLRNELSILDVTPYPNPFENALRLYYRLSKRSDDVRVRVFTVSGRRIFEMENAPGQADVNVFDWDGRDDAGNLVANGTYLVHVRAEGSGGVAEEVARVVKMR